MAAFPAENTGEQRDTPDEHSRCWGAYCVCVLTALEPEQPEDSDFQHTFEENIQQIEHAFCELAAIQSFRPHQGTAVLILSELHSG